MSKRSEALYLGDMLEASRRAYAKAAAAGRDALGRDEDLQMILTHLIQIVGEAARNISETTRVAHPEIPWSEITGMRHKVVHDYFRVDLDTLWDTINHDLPSLIAALEKITPPEPPSA
jgi:uncharacterized protein with HEPN domain